MTGVWLPVFKVGHGGLSACGKERAPMLVFTDVLFFQPSWVFVSAWPLGFGWLLEVFV